MLATADAKFVGGRQTCLPRTARYSAAIRLIKVACERRIKCLSNGSLGLPEEIGLKVVLVAGGSAQAHLDNGSSYEVDSSFINIRKIVRCISERQKGSS